MKKILLVAVALFGLIALPGLSHAEPYVSAYVGGAFPQDADIVDNTGLGLTGTTEFDTGLALGLKGGYWFTQENAPFLGIQLDINRHDTTAKTTMSGVVAGFPVGLASENDVTVTSYTANVLFRSPEGNIRPYAGIGAGWFTGEIDDGIGAVAILDPFTGTLITVTGPIQGTNDTAFGWQVLAGVDFIINPNLSVFGEYKYSRADFSFGGDIATDLEYGVSQVYGGVSYHF